MFSFKLQYKRILWTNKNSTIKDRPMVIEVLLVLYLRMRGVDSIFLLPKIPPSITLKRNALPIEEVIQ